ncbi:hypothetical protein CDAR_592571 [Caerostris darwini]|uniref:Uncharacterized protein n=1 Tax=Caerostris darwini TaxID=1538125 RepID=A0AAV4QJT4_9ARAC|nr:hypothetical protein CDAR_592571 [Caerostris darwini]
MLKDKSLRCPTQESRISNVLQKLKEKPKLCNSKCVHVMQIACKSGVQACQPPPPIQMSPPSSKPVPHRTLKSDVSRNVPDLWRFGASCEGSLRWVLKRIYPSDAFEIAWMVESTFVEKTRVAHLRCTNFDPVNGAPSFQNELRGNSDCSPECDNLDGSNASCPSGMSQPRSKQWGNGVFLFLD